VKKRKAGKVLVDGHEARNSLRIGLEVLAALARGAATLRLSWR
jgi:hypothetical protein